MGKSLKTSERTHTHIQLAMHTLRIRRWDPSSIKNDRIIMIVGRRGTGKSVVQRDLMRHMRERVEFGIAMTPTEDSVAVYEQHMPDTCIYRQFEQQKLEDMITMQRSLLRRQKPVRHLYLLMDDCIYDKKVLKSKAMRDLFLNGRHLHIHLSCAVQYMMDMGPDLRSNIDYIVCTRDVIIANKTKLWKYFFGVFERFEDFSRVFDKCTENHSTIVMDNTVTGTSIEDCVYWYRADPSPPPFKMGRQIFWSMSDTHAKTDDEKRHDARVADYSLARPRARTTPVIVHVADTDGRLLVSTKDATRT